MNFPSDKPFLKDFFDVFYEKLVEKDIQIHSIKHEQWAEKYFLSKERSKFIIDFYFDNSKRFTTAKPDKTNSIELYNSIKEIILQGL